MSIKFQTRVTKVEVREKKIKIPGSPEMGDDYIVQKIGKLTLEFDGDRVDTSQLAEFVGKDGSYIGLADTQMQLGGGL